MGRETEDFLTDNFCLLVCSVVVSRLTQLHGRGTNHAVGPTVFEDDVLFLEYVAHLLSLLGEHGEFLEGEVATDAMEHAPTMLGKDLQIKLRECSTMIIDLTKSSQLIQRQCSAHVWNLMQLSVGFSFFFFLRENGNEPSEDFCLPQNHFAPPSEVIQSARECVDLRILEEPRDGPEGEVRCT